MEENMSSDKFITADEASKLASQAPIASDIILNRLYGKIKKASRSMELSTSELIPRGELMIYKSTIKRALEEQGYTVVVKEFKKVAPCMDHAAMLLIGW